MQRFCSTHGSIASALPKGGGALLLLRRLAICSLPLVFATMSCRQSGGGKPAGASTTAPAASQPGVSQMSVPWVTDGHIVELTISPVSQEDIVEVHRRIDDPETIRRFEKMVEDLRPRWQSLGSSVIGLRVSHKFSVTWDGGQQCDYRIGGDMVLCLNYTLSLNEDQYKFVDKLCQDMDKIGS